MKVQNLLQRLDEIGSSLERSKHALALIGLGSVGLECDRLDSYSDLDSLSSWNQATNKPI
jgi:lincosamide nucleotidyltransferase B/F